MKSPVDMDARTRARVVALLEAYGADPLRWPDADREAHAPMLADRALAEAAREARLLDRTLALASDPRPPDGAGARLLARMAAEEGSGNVVGLPAGRVRRRLEHGPLPAISALAASLAIGLYLGASGFTGGLVPGVAEATEVVQIEDLEVLDGTIGFLAESEGT